MTEPVTCSVCGRARVDSSDDALTWVFEVTDGRRSWLCPDCARVHVRDIESKLDRDFW